jgi:type VI secretion system FHA domain protein
MTLILELEGPAGDQVSPRRKRFGNAPATIGRDGGNDWVLPNVTVSGRHATIECTGGVFWITDTSTNGTFINTKQNRLPKNRKTRINSGDLLIIEPYRIHATIETGASAAPADDPFSTPRDVQPVSPGGTSELDPLIALGFGADRPRDPAVPRIQDLQQLGSDHDYYRPPAVETPSPSPVLGRIPQGYDPLDKVDPAASVGPAPDPFEQAPAENHPRPQPRRDESAPIAAREPRPTSELAALLAGAGLPAEEVTPQLTESLGRILRVVVSGVMDALKARQQIKEEFRIRATRLKPDENNALKFSANLTDALHNLLVKRNPAYLGPVESFEDAFEDLRCHQVALIAGVRAALESLLAELGPDRLEAEFASKVKKSLLGGPPEAQYWALYRDRVADLAKDPEATYRRVFGERFVRAYEEEFERLRGEHRNGRP